MTHMHLNYADLVRAIDEEKHGRHKPARPPTQRRHREHTVPCAEQPDLFFAEQPREYERAKRLCRRCPLRTGCLAGALERGEPWGVWGGELVINGVVTAHKRGRGRPPKVAVVPA
jgi:WhiB family transcriptional regulator, redox-sensing transcriptional regulator